MYYPFVAQISRRDVLSSHAIHKSCSPLIGNVKLILATLWFLK